MSTCNYTESPYGDTFNIMLCTHTEACLPCVATQIKTRNLTAHYAMVSNQLSKTS